MVFPKRVQRSSGGSDIATKLKRQKSNGRARLEQKTKHEKHRRNRPLLAARSAATEHFCLTCSGGAASDLHCLSGNVPGADRRLTVRGTHAIARENLIDSSALLAD